MKFENPHMHVNSPRMGNRVTRAIGSLGLKLIGWTLEGQMPDAKKFIILGVPHTSNWDAIAATLAMLASGFRYTFLIKKEWFFWPMGPYLKALVAFQLIAARAAPLLLSSSHNIFKTPIKSASAFRQKGLAAKLINIK